MPQWTMQTEEFRSDTSSRASRELEDVAAIVQQATPLAGSQLELSLRTRSSQVVLPSVEAALLRVKATIRELREKQQFIATSKVLFPLESLKVLAISLPSRPREPDIFQAAVRLAPNLEFLQLYVNTHNATESALRFLPVLAELPKVTSLRLVTNGNAACLLPSCLMHITCLELGCQVYFRQVPPKLRKLCLEGLDLDWLGYEAMMSALQHAIAPADLTLTSFVVAAMPCLPGNLQKLSLQHSIVGYGDIEDFCTLHIGIARLANLRILCVADFLGDFPVSFLSGMVFPNLHTFGFCLDSQANDNYYIMDNVSGSSILQPTEEIGALMRVFPNLKCMKVYCVGLDAKIMKFDCGSFKWIFRKLRSITCYRTHVNVEFMNLEKRVCVICKV